MNATQLSNLIEAARPFLRIDGARQRTWCRDVKEGDVRLGPWRFQAEFTVISEAVWRRRGEVLYFVTDRNGALRMVGESSRRLKDRWRISPMLSIDTKEPIGRALFHNTAWPAIERGLDTEAAPFTVSALFSEDLAQVVGDIRSAAPGDTSETWLPRPLALESMILREFRVSLGLWNRALSGPTRARRNPPAIASAMGAQQ